MDAELPVRARDVEAALRACGVPVEAAYRPALGHALDKAYMRLGGLATHRKPGRDARPRAASASPSQRAPQRSLAEQQQGHRQRQHE